MQIQVYGLMRTPSAAGEVDGMPVRLYLHQESQVDTMVCVAVTAQTADGISLRPPGQEPEFAVKMGIDGPSAFEIGDPDFDSGAVVHGLEPRARALLNAATRAAVLAALNDGLTVIRGVVFWSQMGMTYADELEAGVRKACAFARLLQRGHGDEALAAVARDDICDVAIGALTVMQPGPIREALSAEFIEGSTDALAMAAATYHGEDVALRVQQVLANVANPAPLRAQALRWLGQHIDATRLAHDYVEEVGFAEAALDVLEDAGAAPELERLTRLSNAGVGVALQVVRAARRHGAAAEPLLLDLLDAKDKSVVIAAAKALGDVGTTAAVSRLHERVKDIYIEFDERNAVLNAVEALQGRVVVEPGGLTLNDGGGQLAIAEDAAGRLSDPAEVARV